MTDPLTWSAVRRRILVIAAIVAAALVPITLAGAWLVERVDPSRVGVGSALRPVAVSAVAWLGAVVITLAGLPLIRWGIHSATRARGAWSFAKPLGNEDDRPGAAAQVLASGILAVAVTLAFNHLLMPLRAQGRAVLLPLASPRAGALLIPLGIALALEAGLALARIFRVPGWRWRLARAAMHLGWCVLMVWVITGPNIFIGDPLEWGDRLNLAGIDQRWLVMAPRALAFWWPPVQIVLTATLLPTLVSATREAVELGRTFRRR